jgi:hypothetical protein
LWDYLSDNQLGGVVSPNDPGVWRPWSKGTVRDHLRGLVSKGFVIQSQVGRRAYYKPSS